MIKTNNYLVLTLVMLLLILCFSPLLYSNQKEYCIDIGISVGTPAGLNLLFNIWRLRHGISINGMYLSVANNDIVLSGVELNYLYKLLHNKKNSIYLYSTAGLGYTNIYSPASSFSGPYLDTQLGATLLAFYIQGGLAYGLFKYEGKKAYPIQLLGQIGFKIPFCWGN